MGVNTNISWTNVTWNIARGCHKVDADCLMCYMHRESLNGTRYDPKTVIRTKKVFTLPLRIKEPSKIFTSSLTDFFIEEIDEYREEAWDIIRRCPQHTFQILTKRPERIADHLPADWGAGWPNVWIGTSIGSQAAIHRIEHMFSFSATVRFLSLEPLHGPIDLNYPKEFFPDGPTRCCSGRECGCHGLPMEAPVVYGFDQVIIGGESGNENGKYRYRPCEIKWIEDLVSTCRSVGTAVFVKQLGTYLARQYGLKDRHGTNMEEWPEELNHLKIREFPQ